MRHALELVALWCSAAILVAVVFCRVAQSRKSAEEIALRHRQRENNETWNTL